MSGVLYMLNVKCAGGCLKDVIGRIRPEDEEFTPEELKEFFDGVRASGWIEKGDNWFCGEVCPGNPFSIENLRKEFSLPKNRLYKHKLTNSNFFTKGSVTNLDPE